MLKEGINEIINKQGSMYIQTWGRLKQIAMDIEIFENLLAHQFSKFQFCTFVMFQILCLGNIFAWLKAAIFPFKRNFSSFMMNKDAYISLALIDEMN